MTLISDTRSLTQRFLDVRATTDLLASRLSAEDQTPQSMPDASPAKWHRAHTTWFFEEFILRPDPAYTEYDPSYRYLFNSYYEAVGPRHPRPQRGLVTRPGIADVARYREYVQDAVVRALEAGRLDEHAQTLVELGCNHEQQHQELLLMDIKHLFSTHPFAPIYVDRPADAAAAARPLTWRSVPGGIIEVGHDGDGFAYDNEGPRHRVYLEDFEIAERAVTNADWLEFMADGGYQRAELWLSDGWAHISAEGWDAPGYWDEQDGSWTTFTLSGRRPVVPAEPVCHVSFYEADAFARWAGARLPTEFEWEAAAGAGGRPARAAARPGPRPSRPWRGRRWSATCGSGPRRPTCPTRGSSRNTARSVSTTASSCATSTCCAARARPRRPGTSGSPTATSSRPTPAGRSAVCGWPK